MKTKPRLGLNCGQTETHRNKVRKIRSFNSKARQIQNYQATFIFIDFTAVVDLDPDIDQSN